MLLKINRILLPNRAIIKLCIKIQQKRRRTYDVTKWRVRATIVAVEINK